MSPEGIDDVSFLFSANPDEPPKPLTRVASGGELSRIMLVLKEAIASRDGGSVIIFDEADSGIGGAVAETVGGKIKNLSDLLIRSSVSRISLRWPSSATRTSPYRNR